MSATVRWTLALSFSLALHAALVGALLWAAARPEALLGPLSPAPASALPADGGRR